MTTLCDFKRDTPTILTWLKYLLNNETRTRNKLYNLKYFYRNHYQFHFQWQIKCSKGPNWPARMPSGV